jgi:hypothetical protein
MKILQIQVNFVGEHAAPSTAGVAERDRAMIPPGEQTLNIRRLKYTQQAHLFVLLRRALKGENKDVPTEFNESSDFVALAEAKIEAIAKSICDENGKTLYTTEDIEDWERDDINAVFNRLNEINNAGNDTAAKNS